MAIFSETKDGGVPVYTVGLGWSIDRRFLESISAMSNARFYNSPTLEQLITIFDNLAYLFRTQYIVTISADVPADGRCYDFTLNVTTRDGLTASGAAVLRTPIFDAVIADTEYYTGQ